MPASNLMPAQAPQGPPRLFMTLAEALERDPSTYIDFSKPRNQTLYKPSQTQDLVPPLPRNEIGLEDFDAYHAAADRIEQGLPPFPDETPQPTVDIHGVTFKYVDTAHETASFCSDECCNACVPSPEHPIPAVWRSGEPKRSILKPSPAPVPRAISPLPMHDISDASSSKSSPPPAMNLDYASTASPPISSAPVPSEVGRPSIAPSSRSAGHETSATSPARSCSEIGIQPEPYQAPPSPEASRSVYHRSKSIALERRASILSERSIPKGFEGMEVGPNGALICQLNGKSFEIFIEPGSRKNDVDAGIQCFGEDIDTEMAILFGKPAVEAKDDFPGAIHPEVNGSLQMQQQSDENHTALDHRKDVSKDDEFAPKSPSDKVVSPTAHSEPSRATSPAPSHNCNVTSPRGSHNAGRVADPTAQADAKLSTSHSERDNRSVAASHSGAGQDASLAKQLNQAAILSATHNVQSEASIAHPQLSDILPEQKLQQEQIPKETEATASKSNTVSAPKPSSDGHSQQNVSEEQVVEEPDGSAQSKIKDSADGIARIESRPTNSECAETMDKIELVACSRQMNSEYVPKPIKICPESKVLHETVVPNASESIERGNSQSDGDQMEVDAMEALQHPEKDCIQPFDGLTKTAESSAGTKPVETASADRGMPNTPDLEQKDKQTEGTEKLQAHPGPEPNISSNMSQDALLLLYKTTEMLQNTVRVLACVAMPAIAANHLDVADIPKDATGAIANIANVEDIQEASLGVPQSEPTQEAVVGNEKELSEATENTRRKSNVSKEVVINEEVEIISASPSRSEEENVPPPSVIQEVPDPTPIESEFAANEVDEVVESVANVQNEVANIVGQVQRIRSRSLGGAGENFLSVQLPPVVLSITPRKIIGATSRKSLGAEDNSSVEPIPHVEETTTAPSEQQNENAAVMLQNVARGQDTAEDVIGNVENLPRSSVGVVNNMQGVNVHPSIPTGISQKESGDGDRKTISARTASAELEKKPASAASPKPISTGYTFVMQTCAVDIPCTAPVSIPLPAPTMQATWNLAIQTQSAVKILQAKDATDEAPPENPVPASKVSKRASGRSLPQRKSHSSVPAPVEALEEDSDGDNINTCIIPVEMPPEDEPFLLPEESPLPPTPPVRDVDDDDDDDNDYGDVMDNDITDHVVDDDENNNTTTVSKRGTKLGGVVRNISFEGFDNSRKSTVKKDAASPKRPKSRKRKTRAENRTKREEADKSAAALKHLRIENEKEDAVERGTEQVGVRRSKRQRFPRLKYWRNEGIVYERRKSQVLPTVAEIIVEVGGEEEHANNGTLEDNGVPQKKKGRRKVEEKNRGSPKRKRVRGTPESLTSPEWVQDSPEEDLSSVEKDTSPNTDIAETPVDTPRSLENGTILLS